MKLLTLTCKFWVLGMVCLLPGEIHAQYTFITNNGAITILGYTGAGGVVTIPNTINGYPVAVIGTNAFHNVGSITSITLPTTINSLDDNAFYYCPALTNVVVQGSIYNVGTDVFADCANLRTVTLGNGLTTIGSYMFDNDTPYFLNVIVPNSVTSIAAYGFRECQGMTNIVLSASLTNIAAGAFDIDNGLISAYFLGNAPAAPTNLFSYSPHVTVYYLPHTTGWRNKFGGAPTVLWSPSLPSLGITVYSNQPVVILPYLSQTIGTNFLLQMTTNLASGNWVTVTNGVPFIAVQITNVPGPAYFRLQ